MKLSYCPQMKVVHTSEKLHGQVYVPFLNWLLMLGTILVTAVYNNTTSLVHAYGVCVIFVTFFDTLMGEVSSWLHPLNNPGVLLQLVSASNPMWHGIFATQGGDQHM
ncbi:potassium transporter-domain-containing protein [Dactylonectria estremocensis]|uniref:Potassium transporter-domain-containing protein n=1 Tax=Dactylonectria estremocensis TaxID=1079267 RepID=A0A9P9D1Q0_9HYPO|nr:potassium transporter-domain-containing protein [Dactylonectria estremocensis]